MATTCFCVPEKDRLGRIFASSKESVGRSVPGQAFGLVKQSVLDQFKLSETVRSFHGQFGVVVQPLDNA
jgi:hypothetical protein